MSRRTEDRTSTDGGFSLIEILVIVIILGVLGTVTSITLRSTVARGESRACDEDRATIEKAIDVYTAQTGDTDITMDDLVTARVILDPSPMHQITAGGVVGVGACS